MRVRMSDAPTTVAARARHEGADHAGALEGLLRQTAERVGGRACLLVEREPGSGRRVVSAARAAAAAGGEITDPAEVRAIDAAFASPAPRLIDDVAVALPSVARALGAPAVVLAPVPGAVPASLVAIGLDEGARPSGAALADALAAFATSLELLRLRRGRALRNHVRDLVQRFSSGLSAMPDLIDAYHRLSVEARSVFGASRASIWIHERRARELVLGGSSDAAVGADGIRVAVTEPRAPAARGLRLDRPEFAAAPDIDAPAGVTLLLVPLRGRRRALGTLIIESLQGPVAERIAIAEAAWDLGRQLSTVIENIQLLSEVLRSRQELENTFNSLVDLVAVCDRDGRLVHVNAAFAGRVGATVEALADRSLAGLVGPDLATLVAAHDRAEPPRVSSSGELEDTRLGGTFSVTVSSLLDSDGRRVGTVVVARDVTERARMEAERAALRQQLAQSEKLAALGQFVAGIAHELNNPLQGVLGNLELLRETSQLTAADKRDVRRIHREAERAARIVRNLLLFAGSGRHQRRRFSLNTLVGRVLTLRGRALRKAGIEVSRAFDERIPRLRGTPLLLQQALLNIIINAEHAMSRSGGRLEVATRLSDDGARALVVIRDTGPGLPDEVRRRLFEPFFTTKDVGQGTGLGLALTYGIVHDHGGAVRAGNDPDGGAVFTVELPTDRMVIK